MGRFLFLADLEMTGRYLAGILGALVGDALGVPFEFKAPEYLPAARDITMVMPPPFMKTYPSIPYGTWSDDGSQLLCLQEVLQENAGFDPVRFAGLLVRWARKAYHQSGGVVFDCGGQTDQAIKLLEEGVAPLDAGGTSERSNGNGSLMRTLPVAIAGHRNGWAAQKIVDVAHRQSRVTHGHPRSQACCALYCLMAASLITDPSRPVMDCYRQSLAELSDIYRNGKLEEHARALAAIVEFPEKNFRRGSGYVVDTFWTSLDCMEKSENYISAVKAAVSYGYDTDTTSCVTGGLAGIKYGLDKKAYETGPIGIPSDWVSQLVVPQESARVIAKIPS